MRRQLRFTPLIVLVGCLAKRVDYRRASQGCKFVPTSRFLGTHDTTPLYYECIRRDRSTACVQQ